ncbi:MAG: hypothetical protein Q9176_002840 [Flavoplaca citrina]
MGIPTFDTWAATKVTKSLPLSSLQGSVVGVDATYYLENTAKEPLVSALGGFPFALESSVVRELKDLQSIGLRLHFVFNGLDHGLDDDPFAPSLAAANNNALAFETYENYQPVQAIQVFRNSGAPTPQALAEYLKKTLHKHGIPFTVAPYSALAQLAYFEKHPDGFVDAIYGPAELFLYGVDKIITKFELAHQPYDPLERGNVKKTPQLAPENSDFLWINRGNCLEALGRVSSSVFDNALLLAGSKTLRSFPPTNKPGKTYSFRDTVNLLMGSGGNVSTICNQYADDEEVQRLDYLGRYKQAMAGIRHHVVITSEGDIETLDKNNAPHDLHDCVGQRLPEELNMYLSRGMIRPRVLNWLASGTILILAPYDGGDSKVYQNLVRQQLEPLRRQTLSLLADSLNRYYQRKEITTKYCFDSNSLSSVNIKDLLPSPKDSINAWNVKEDTMLDRRQTLGKQSQDLPLGSLSFALRSLQDANYAATTIIPPTKGQKRQPLRTRAEICANAIWRFLQLRGYVDRQHQLTAWGKVLDSMLSIAGPQAQQEKAALLAVELMRFGLLNADTMFSAYSGAPSRSNDIDKRNCMLVSRVACLGRLIHQPRGYSGPLSRHILAYHSMVSAVQASLRDMLEICLVTMFLEGGVDREREDWMDIALQLPLFDEDSCALGVMMLHYLDELFVREDPTSETTREEMTSKSQGWVVHSDFKASRELAYRLWDAVYRGVKTTKDSGEDVQDIQMWDEVDQWLSLRR